VFEWDNFSKGTQGVLEAVVNATKKGAVTIVGSYCLQNTFYFALPVRSVAVSVSVRL